LNRLATRAQRLSTLTTRQFLLGFADCIFTNSLATRHTSQKPNIRALFCAHVDGMSAKLNRVFSPHACQVFAAVRNSDRNLRPLESNSPAHSPIPQNQKAPLAERLSYLSGRVFASQNPHKTHSE
jgi:hypothetical protein